MTRVLTWARSHVWAVVLLAVAVGLALVGGAPSSSKPDFDPSSTSSSGTRALVLLLERLGVTVHVGGAQPAGAGPALLLVDRLSADDEQSLLRWVAAGHTLVDADPSGGPNGASSTVGDTGAQIRLQNGETLHGDCGLPTLSSAPGIRPYGGSPLSNAEGAVGCYREQDGYFYLLARPLGAGTVVAVASPSPWTNANLAQADNSVLAADLLAVAGHPTVTVLGASASASAVGGGHSGLGGLLSHHVVSLIWQLVVAFVVLSLWRARRLGRPVVEDPPVAIPASELVVARGNLLQEGRHRSQAAAALRSDFARRAGRRLGVPAGSGPDALAAAAEARTGVDGRRVTALLTGADPAGDEALVRLAQEIDQTMTQIGKETVSADSQQ